MLKRYMHNREKYHAFKTDNRIVREFDWGTEFVGGNGGNPYDVFTKYTKDVLQNSDDFFSLSDDLKFEIQNSGLKTLDLEWQSAIETPSAENNRVAAKLFPVNNKRMAVVVLPHWNAPAESYFGLCELFNRRGMSALRLTLPYHESRMPPELERADYLVAPNVGQTLQSVRQAVLDTKAAVRWLKNEGYERVGIVGTSIGSCVAFLAFTHDKAIEVGVFNHVSGYVADVVWQGLSTYHVRESIEKVVSLNDLREFWRPISPMGHVERLKDDPRPQHYIYTLYDLTFPIDLSRETVKEIKRISTAASSSWIPCGHYTLGESPWKYIDGWKITSFLKKNLR
jgi:hypothetical protein